MSDDADSTDRENSGHVALWFLRKLATSPATWIAAVMGTSAGTAASKVMPIGGAIAGGIMIALVTGLFAIGLSKTVSAAYRMERKATSESSRSRAQENEAIAGLREAGEVDEAEILEKILADRDAIVEHCRERPNDTDARHTRELAGAIAEAACDRSDEMIDLSRRAADPLLDVSEAGLEKLESIRREFREAYQAIADARTRLRTGNALPDVDFLDDDDDEAEDRLRSLTSKLNEETAIAKRVEARIKGTMPTSGIIFDDEKPSGENGTRESESEK